MVTFETDGLRKLVKESDSSETVARAVDSIDFLEFSDWDASVKSEVEFVKQHPLILKETVVTGWTYHVESGKVMP